MIFLSFSIDLGDSQCFCLPHYLRKNCDYSIIKNVKIHWQHSCYQETKQLKLMISYPREKLLRFVVANDANLCPSFTTTTTATTIK
jgi:hypothetical protein